MLGLDAFQVFNESPSNLASTKCEDVQDQGKSITKHSCDESCMTNCEDQTYD